MWIKCEGEPRLINIESGRILYVEGAQVLLSGNGDFDSVGEYADTAEAIKKFNNLAAKLAAIRMEDM